MTRRPEQRGAQAADRAPSPSKGKTRIERLARAVAWIPWVSQLALRRLHGRRYQRRFGRAPDLDRPRRFTEYIVHRIIYDRDPLLRVVSDKVAVRDWIDGVLGPGFTVPLLGAWKSADDVPWSSLPVPFVLKPNHASGPYKIVDKPLTAPIIASLRHSAGIWLTWDYFDRSFEWGYRRLPRRITAEPLLRAPDGGSLIEVDVFTFHGEPLILLAFTGSKKSDTERCAIWLDASGARSDMWGSTRMAEDVLDAAGLARMERELEAARPQMIELAARIGAHLPYVRVDFYLTDEGLKVGELTPYPAAGGGIYRPDDADHRLGAMLRESGRRRRARGLKPYPWPPLD